MSTIAKAPLVPPMTTEEFFAWSETWTDGERYELVEGRALRLQSEQISHSQHKASAWLALRNAISSAGLDCTAFPDGVSVRIDDRNVREPDALVHRDPYEASEVSASNPVVVVEVVSPSSIRTDPGRKLIDYVSVPSILHYLILYGDEERVVHHRRISAGGDIATRILLRGDVIELSPPGFTVTVEELFDS